MLNLTFNEPVRRSSLDAGEISIQNVNDVTNAGTNEADTPVPLITSSTSSDNGLNLVIDLSDSDFNR